MIKSKARIKLLTRTEVEKIYAIPDFTQQERVHYFTLEGHEQAILDKLGNVRSKLYFVLQLGYFKAKHLLFDFAFTDVRADVKYNMARYFSSAKRPKTLPSRNIIAKNNKQILKLLQFKVFSKATKPMITHKINNLTRQLNKPLIIFQELLLYLEQVKITLPEYSTLQDLMGKALIAEETRLGTLVIDHVTPKIAVLIEQLFTVGDLHGRYDLTLLKRYPKNFNFKIIQAEIEKHKKHNKLYLFAKQFLPKLEISRLNIIYYASLVEHYQVQALQRFSVEKRQLYLICYIYHRFQSMNDQLIQTLIHYVSTYKKDAKIYAAIKANESGNNIRGKYGKQAQQLLYMYIDPKLSKSTYKSMQKKAIEILPKDNIITVGEYISGGKANAKQYEWEYHGNNYQAMLKNLRPLIKVLDFQASSYDQAALAGLKFIQAVFRKGKTLADIDIDNFPLDTIPSHLEQYILKDETSGSGKHSSKATNHLHPYKYEFHLYAQLKKNIDANIVYANDTTQYKSLKSDLGLKNWPKNKKSILAKLDLPLLNRSATAVLKELNDKLESLYISVNARIANGENPHIKIKGEGNKRTWTLPYQKKHDEYNNPFYDQLPLINISDLLDFVEAQCGFMRAFTHIKPHFANSQSDIKGIEACLIANATGLGVFKMSESSDLSYTFLQDIESNYIRLETLQKANDIINQKAEELPIYKHYNVIENVAHAGADGQKYKTRRNTFNSRHSPKYYGLDKGVAPYSLVLNHFAINGISKGAHEHESHYLWEVYHHNTSGINADRISTDTEGSNQINFDYFYFKGVDYAPCYRSISKKTQHLYGFNPLNTYNKNDLIRPSHKSNEKQIKAGWSELQAVMASALGNESSPSVITKKLSSHAQKSKTKDALWELNNILRSIYLLRYIDDLQLRQVVRTALNRTEAYHALRRHIGESNGMGFRGASDLEIAIWDACARLVTNAVSFYNEYMLSMLMEMKEAEGDLIAAAFIRGLSPAAAQHIIFKGRYEFNKNQHPINIQEVLASMNKIINKNVKFGEHKIKYKKKPKS